MEAKILELNGTESAIYHIDQLTKENILRLIVERNDMLSDIKLLKDNLLKLCTSLSLINEDGGFKEKPSMIVLLPKVMKYMSNTDLLKDDFGFMIELLPMILKYKNL